jgi:hypothetical protein
MHRLRCAGSLPAYALGEWFRAFAASSFSACRPALPRRVHRLLLPSPSATVSPSPTSPLGSALSCLHFNPLHVVGYFGVFWFAHSLPPAELLASPADLTRATGRRLSTPNPCPSQPRLLLPSFRLSRSPFSPSGITTVAPGRLHWQDFHLLEPQLASRHQRVSKITSQKVQTVRGGPFFSAPSEARVQADNQRHCFHSSRVAEGNFTPPPSQNRT